MGIIESNDAACPVITRKSIANLDVMHWPYYNGMVQGALKAEIEHFVSATLDSSPFLVDTENAISAFGVIEGCFASIKENRPVEIGPAATGFSNI